MPDVIIDCPECGREYKVSQYATLDGMTCLTCGAGLTMPHFERVTDGLKLKKLETLLRSPRQMTIKASNVGAMAATMAPEDLLSSHPVPQRFVHEEFEVRETPKWISIVVAALLVALFVGFQYKAVDFDQYLFIYTWARSIFAIAAFSLVVMIAYQDSIGQGALCLFIAPYSLFYTAGSVESGLLRGLYFGMLIVLIAEIFFLPDQSVFLAAGAMFSDLVGNVDGLIKSASDPLK